MYFGYGLPRTLACSLGRDQETWVALQQDHQFLIAVTGSTVQLWSAGLHRVRLSAVDCTNQATGTNVDAHWCSSKSTLAVLTDTGHLNIYHVHFSQEPAVPEASGVKAKELCKATIYLRHTSLIESQTQPTCLAGDGKMLLVGCQDGSIQLFTWLGKMRDVLLPTFLCDEDAPEMPPGSVASMHYCDRSRLLAVVLTNGSCALLTAGVSGAGSLITELEFSHWVCYMGASCARINAVAQLVAVGTTLGHVALYRLHVRGSQGAPDMTTAAQAGSSVGGDAPVRQLSMEPWGHPLMQTGPISKVEWSPDGRVLAVGYQHTGVVVWSPSGCRLFSSIRQAPDSGRSSSLAISRTPTAGATTTSASLFSDPAVQMAASQSIRAGDIGLAEGGLAPGMMLPGKGSLNLSGLQQGPLDGGVAVLSWGPGGYMLTIGHTGGSWALEEVQFANSLPHHHRVAHAPYASLPAYGTQSVEELHVLQAHDRLLLVAESAAAARAGGAGLHGTTSHGGGRGEAAGQDAPEPAGTGRASELSVTHLPLPYQYLATNWPVCHVAVNPNGMDIAVAGRTGLALYSRALDKWRLFGDISQERRVACVALGWTGNVVLACTRADDQFTKGSRPGAGPAQRAAAVAAAASQPHQLLLFPKHHLDFSSLLCRFPLAQAPVAMDCIGRHVLMAFEGMDLALFEVVINGDVKPSSHATATLQLVRDISMLEVGRPLTGITLVQFKRQVSALHSTGGGAEEGPLPPTQCVLHRWGGLLSVLDLERGSEVTLGTDIEAFWISHILREAPAAPTGTGSGAVPTKPGPSGALAAGPVGDATNTNTSSVQGPQAHGSAASSLGSATSLEGTTGPREVDLPWWGYGPQGMQLWFSSSFLPAPGLQSHRSHSGMQGSSSGIGTGLVLPRHPSGGTVDVGGGRVAGPLTGSAPTPQDLELEFDAEVYPVGISLADAAIVGITQRTVRGQVARSAAGGLPAFHLIPESQPVLPCLLRRLLLRGALLEARALALRHSSGPHFSRSLEWLLFTALEAEADRPTPPGGAPSLLALAASLLRSFPQLHAECVVAVARKTDISLWPHLFKAVGSPSSLLDGLMERGSLTAAANMLLVVDSMEGPDNAYSKAVRLLQVTLARGQYNLASELLRFILFPNEGDSEELQQAAHELTEAAGNENGHAQGKAQASAHLSPHQSGDAGAAQGLARRPSLSLSQRDSGGGHKKAGGSSVSWFGWLLGYGGGSTTLQQQNSSTPHGHAGHGTQRQLSGHLSQQLSASQAAPGKAGTITSAATPPSAAHTTLSQHASAARRAAAEHAWGLLEQGRLLQLLQLATATTFLPGGLMQLMRQHQTKTCSMALQQSQSLRPSHSAGVALGQTPPMRTNEGYGASSYAITPKLSGCQGGAAGGKSLAQQPSMIPPPAPAPVTYVDLLSALSLVVTQLPMWQSPEVEEDARGVLEVVTQLEPYAQVWVLALSILLVELDPVRLYAQQQPTDWVMFARVVKQDKTFAFLHSVIDMLGESGADLEGDGEQPARPLPSYSPALS